MTNGCSINDLSPCNTQSSNKRCMENPEILLQYCSYTFEMSSVGIIDLCSNARKNFNVLVSFWQFACHPLVRRSFSVYSSWIRENAINEYVDRYIFIFPQCSPIKLRMLRRPKIGLWKEKKLILFNCSMRCVLFKSRSMFQISSYLI